MAPDRATKLRRCAQGGEEGLVGGRIEGWGEEAPLNLRGPGSRLWHWALETWTIHARLHPIIPSPNGALSAGRCPRCGQVRSAPPFCGQSRGAQARQACDGDPGSRRWEPGSRWEGLPMKRHVTTCQELAALGPKHTHLYTGNCKAFCVGRLCVQPHFTQTPTVLGCVDRLQAGRWSTPPTRPRLWAPTPRPSRPMAWSTSPARSRLFPG